MKAFLICFFVSSVYFCASPAQSAEPYAEMYIWKAELTRGASNDTLQFWVDFTGLDRPVLDDINLQVKDPLTNTWFTATSVSNPDTHSTHIVSTPTMTPSGTAIQNNYFIRSDGRRDQPSGMNDVLMIRDAATVIAPTADSAFFLTEAKAFEHPRDYYETFVRAYGAVGDGSTHSYWLEWWQWNYVSNSWVEQDETPLIIPNETLLYTFHKKLDRDYADKSVTPPEMKSEIVFKHSFLPGDTLERVFNPELREQEKPVSSLSGQKNITNATIVNQAAQTQTSFDYHFDWRERFEMKVAITVNAVQPPLGTYWLHGWWHGIITGDVEELKLEKPPTGYYIVEKPVLSYLDFGNSIAVTTQLEGYGGPKTDVDFISANYDNSLPNHKVWAQDTDP